MTLNLELTEEQGRLLLDSARRQDEDSVRQLLKQAIEAMIQKLLFQPPTLAEGSDFEALSRRLSASFSASPSHRSLSSEALTRESIYGDDRR